jgi:hypothetical protein
MLQDVFLSVLVACQHLPEVVVWMFLVAMAVTVALYVCLVAVLLPLMLLGAVYRCVVVVALVVAEVFHCVRQTLPPVVVLSLAVVNLQLVHLVA